MTPKLSQQFYPSIDFSSAGGLTSRHLQVLQGFIWIMKLKALFLCIWWKQLPPILHSWDRALPELSMFTWWSCEIRVLCALFLLWLTLVIHWSSHSYFLILYQNCFKIIFCFIPYRFFRCLVYFTFKNQDEYQVY